ncbi:hypothetical protein Bca4012_040332 [Brassica carinata]
MDLGQVFIGEFIGVEGRRCLYSFGQLDSSAVFPCLLPWLILESVCRLLEYSASGVDFDGFDARTRILSTLLACRPFKVAFWMVYGASDCSPAVISNDCCFLLQVPVLSSNSDILKLSGCLDILH